jgi:ribosomal protein S3
MALNYNKGDYMREKIETITQRLLTNVAEVKYGTVSVALKIHDGGIVETSYTVSECTKEKEPKQEDEVNPEWGRNRKGFVGGPREALS